MCAFKVITSLFVVILSQIATQVVLSQYTHTSDRFPALNALFNNSYFDLPIINGTVSKALQYNLSDVKCGNLYINKLLTRSSTPPKQHFSLDMLGLSLDCTGSWAYTVQGDTFNPGTFKALVTNISFLTAVDGKENDKYHLPQNFSVSSCDFESHIFTSFKGEVVAWILDILRPIVDKAIEVALHSTICTAASHIVTSTINNITTDIVAVLGPFLDDPTAPVVPDPAPAPTPSPNVNWANVPLLSNLISVLDSGGPTLVNGLVSILTDFTGTFSDLPLGNLTFRNNASIINSSLELQSLTITGADSVTAFDILDPDRKNDNRTIDSIVTFDQLGIDIIAKLSMWRGSDLIPSSPPSAASPLSTLLPVEEDKNPLLITQQLKLSFNLTNASLGLDIYAALRTSEEDGLGSLKLGQLSDVQCWFSKMDALSILLLDISLTNISGPALVQLIQSDDKPSDLWHSLEDIVQHVEVDYYPALLSVLPQLSNNLVKMGINLLLFSMLQESEAKCEANPLDSAGYVDFTSHTQGIGFTLWLLDLAMNNILKVTIDVWKKDSIFFFLYNCVFICNS